MKNENTQRIDNEQVPAVLHSLGVFNAAIRYGIRVGWILKAYLCHDLLEDTNVTVDQLTEYIGKQATEVVIELTFCPNEMSKPKYIASFQNKSIVALGGKIIDRIENVDDFGIISPKYAKEYLNKANLLIESFFDRRKEIIVRFGIHTMYNLEDAIYTVREKYAER